MESAAEVCNKWGNDGDGSMEYSGAAAKHYPQVVSVSACSEHIGIPCHATSRNARE